MDSDAAGMPGHIGSQKAHHKLAVGVNHIKMHIQRLTDCAIARQGHIPIPQENKLGRLQIVQVVTLKILPALAFGAIHMHFVAPALQLLIEIQAGGCHAVDLRVKGIGKYSNLHGCFLSGILSIPGHYNTGLFQKQFSSGKNKEIFRFLPRNIHCNNVRF